MEVADCDRRWLYVLLHGEDELVTGWDVSWITPKQAGELLAVLTDDLSDDIGYDLMREFRRRAAEHEQ